MEQVNLSRFQTTGLLGSGADYEVRAAVDQETGKPVVLKRPMPQMVSRQMHASTEARTDRMLDVFQRLDHSIPNVVPMVGYTDRANHDEFYGDSLGQEYRVVIEERARGIPLFVEDMRARITGVPIGVGQNLFALFPLIQPDDQQPHAIHQQLLDTQEAFFEAGYVLLDLRPQNLFYQPASGRVTIVDCTDLVPTDGAPNPRGGPPRDIHDAYLEMLKFYTTSQEPPAQTTGYGPPHGLRPVVNFQQELDEVAEGYSEAAETVRVTARQLIANVKSRGYTDLAVFRQDLSAYLDAVSARNEQLPYIDQARQAWGDALESLRGDHWQRYLFDAETELGPFTR